MSEVELVKMKLKGTVISSLQTLIVLCSIQLIFTEKSRCNPTLCDCTEYSGDTYPYQNVISCTKNDANVRFEIMNYTDAQYIKRLGHPLIKAFVECNNNDQLVFDVISQTNFEYFDSIEYIKCPVPLNSSLGNGMPILEELIFMENNGETTVNNHWKPIHFDGLTNLRNIDLTTETLDQLSNDTFAALSKLKEVDLKMKHPNLYLFPSAETFRLSSVDGDDFNTNSLKRNSKLKLMHIISSEFNPLTNNAMEGLQELQKLFFYGNRRLLLDPDCLNHLVNLEEITFIENKITNFPNGLFDKNKQLREVMIQSEKFQSLPNGMFSDLPKLNKVSISYCDLESIPSDIFKNSNSIEVVNFIATKIATLPQGIFDNLSNIKDITLLRNNRLASLSKGLFDNLPKLEVVNLAGNQFQSISAANIQVASNALYIDLSMNQIRDITADELHIFEKNTTVHLGFNQIARFSGIAHLRKNIGRYNSTVLLRENPFDCSTCDVFHIVQERAPEYDDPDDFVTKPFSIDTFALKCRRPAEFASKSVRHLNLTNYNCHLDL